MGLFHKKTKRPNAIAFVDYEYWFYSYDEHFNGLRPDIEKWSESIHQQYDVRDIMVFGDFTPLKIKNEPVSIRRVTNTIIETLNDNGFRTKDMTDFILLDYIYQIAAERPEIDTFILFTGDGHFHSVVKYLVQKLKKNVIIYGITGSFSRNLVSAATEHIELPTYDEYLAPICELIYRNFEYVDEKKMEFVTFSTTISTISKFYKVPEEPVRLALEHLCKTGELKVIPRPGVDGRDINTLQANWTEINKVRNYQKVL